MPKKSFTLINLIIPYGKVPERVIDKATIDKITPHPLSANRPAEATIPVTAAGQARLIARVILAA